VRFHFDAKEAGEMVTEITVFLKELEQLVAEMQEMQK